ncbi:hypothetical protein B0J13DRAFT_664125 [Dactylonectria estremocensis]|uniref:Rab-GAP TBC domain-containing protein n=1 Tax=Dactylonectria estremocensis TaxID=1079267 RepID=A0A9P9J4C6_9HYPO|nr:hypothetical protein B0J13DRAFT_664125 [Dactylonectria estremocensis]
MTPLAMSVPEDSGPGSLTATCRNFPLYGNRLRESDNSPVSTTSTRNALPYASPLASPLASSLASRRVHIVPFGYAYRYTCEPSGESPLQLPPLSILPRWDSLSNSSKFILQQPASSPAFPFEPPTHPPLPFAYDTASTPSNSRNHSLTFPLASMSSRANLRSFDSPSMPMENFSRPRKQSIRQPVTDTAKPWVVLSAPAYNYNSADQDVEVSSPQHPLGPPSRPRGPSVSSCHSFSTYHSVLSPPANNVYEPRPPRPPRARTTNDAACSAARPPLSSTNGGSASPGTVIAPWKSGEELHSSFRSQFTESTAPGTVVTAQSSILTKDSSVTSLYPSLEGGAEPEAEADKELDPDINEPSLENVMGMYEKGFDDDDESDYDNIMNARPVTSVSGIEPCRSLIEAIEDEDLPQRHIPEIPATLDVEIRMSKVMFTYPPFTSSVPHMAENFVQRSTDERDLAKSLDSEPSINPQQLPSATEHASTRLSSISTLISPPISPPILAPEALEPEPTPPVIPAAPAEPEDPDSRDRYGFKKENQYVTRHQYDTWHAGYTEYLARRRKKWVTYLKDNAFMTDHPNRFPSPNAKTKRFVHKGIPPEWRGAAWFYYAGGPAILAQHSGLYDKLASKRAGNVDAEAIERGLHHTFPDNIKFRPPGGVQTASSSTRESQTTLTDSTPSSSPAPLPSMDGEPPIITSLRRVLHAFAVYNPRIGYCHSLNFLAGLLLLFVETEEQCFWLLNVTALVYLPGTHDLNLEGSMIDLGVLMAELRNTMPDVWAKIGGELEADPNSRLSTSNSTRLTCSTRKELSRMSNDRLPPSTVCMTAWFTSCFIGTLPIESTLRVWDVFFYEGSKTLFRVALAILKLGESEVKAVSDSMEMFGVVQAMPRCLIDANALMEASFKRHNGFGHLSQGQINERRQEHRAKAQLERVRHGENLKNFMWNVAPSETEGRQKGPIFRKKQSPTSL